MKKRDDFNMFSRLIREYRNNTDQLEASEYDRIVNKTYAKLTPFFYLQLKLKLKFHLHYDDEE